eukprot:402272_1
MFQLLYNKNDQLQYQFDQCQKEIKDLKKKINEKLKCHDKFILKTKANKKLDNDELHRLPTKEFKLKCKYHGHFDKIYSLSWDSSNNGNSNKLLSASKDGHLIIWNIETNKKELVIPLETAGTVSCAYSPDGTYICSGGMDNTISIFNVENSIGWEVKAAILELKEHNGFISSIKCIQNNSSQLLTSSGDRSVKLWDIEKQKSLCTYINHTQDVECIDINIEKTLFVSGSVDNMIYVQDYRMNNNKDSDASDEKNNSTKLRFKGHDSDVNAVKWFPDNNAFLSGSEDSTVKLWDLRSMQQLNEYRDRHKSPDDLSVTSIDCSKSGYYVIAGFDESPCCMIWNVMTSRMELNDDRQKQLVHPSRVSCLQVSPKGNSIATGSWDTIVRQWN